MSGSQKLSIHDKMVVSDEKSSNSQFDAGATFTVVANRQTNITKDCFFNCSDVIRVLWKKTDTDSKIPARGRDFEG